MTSGEIRLRYSTQANLITYGPKSSIVVCDLVFRHKGRIAAVEYQGGLYHTGQSNVYRDSMRANALSAAGIPMLTLTKEQLRDVDQLHRFAMQLSKCLGVRFRPQIPDFYSRRDALHEALLRNPLP